MQVLEYKVTSPSLPPHATSPVMDYRQMTDWLNNMVSQGWEFVSYGATHWYDQGVPQQWWIFKRVKKVALKGNAESSQKGTDAS